MSIMLEIDCEPSPGRAEDIEGPILVTKKSIDLRNITPKNVPVIEPMPPTIIKPMYHIHSPKVNCPVETEP
jgi:hypothetical protein